MIKPTFYRKSENIIDNGLNLRHKTNLLHGVDVPDNDEIINDAENQANEQDSYEQDVSGQLLYRHTEMVLAILTKFNEDIRNKQDETEDVNIEFYQNINDVILEYDVNSRQNILILDTNKDLRTVVTRYRGIEVSQHHLEFMSVNRDVSLQNQDIHQKLFLETLFYPYSASKISMKNTDVKLLFDFSNENTYEFYRRLFKDPKTQEPILDYMNLIEKSTLGTDLINFIEMFDSPTYEKCLFLTWIKIKGQGKSHINKYNTKTIPGVIPVTERHVHLALMLKIICQNWPAKCYTSESHLSLLKVLSRKCFNAKLQIHIAKNVF